MQIRLRCDAEMAPGTMLIRRAYDSDTMQTRLRYDEDTIQIRYRYDAGMTKNYTDTQIRSKKHRDSTKT